MRRPTGETPYMLVYDTEAVIPAKFEIPSLRVIQEAMLDDTKWTRVRNEQLMVIEENRMDAELSKKFTKIEFKHIPGIQNGFAEAIATFSSMIQHPVKNYIDPIKIEIKFQHAYCFHIDTKLDDKPWYNNIKRFLEIREYPENATNRKKQTLRRLANQFFLNGEVFYRRTPYLGLLRCVDVVEATRSLEEIHAGTCGPHVNGFTLANTNYRAGYFWMTM
ncbi:uncharacterized protein LOC142163971 [Nicotiana tabacum]|uniref:Uncharacterized protein LOC142163971 n=1 Tax=Nicotiana tabacum TaxID=4097 RepID=A0AC58RX09_TOBAC